jgi:menaquinone-dependent protoporphyrinogen IX oxidase
MKTLILYVSKCGNTKKYAEDIGALIHADVFPLKKFKSKKMGEYDAIVFGGWVRGGTIQGLDKFLQSYKFIEKKNVIVFSVGMSVPSKEGRAILIEQNLLDMYHVRYYQFRGSFDITKLDFISKLMIQNSLKMIINDPDCTEDQKSLLSIKDRPIEHYDHEKVDKIVSVINQLSLGA